MELRKKMYDISSFMNMHILDIIAKESKTSDKLYLYEEDGRWYAYEYSAIVISNIHKGIFKIKMVVNEIYEVVLHRVEVDLNMILSCARVLSCSDSGLVITYSKR